ncbi:MAG: NAD(P)-binding domain-containing protein [Ferruginibacter sp.]
MDNHTKLLIVGAGPFGLSLSAYAKKLGIDHIIIGKPMEFWKMNMPKGMFLRSTCDWHLDVTNEYSIDKFLETRLVTCKDVEPLSLDFYLEYAEWFIEQNQLNIIPVYITELYYNSDLSYKVICEDGTVLFAQNVVVAAGLKYFKHLPAEIIDRLPAGSYSHTCDFVNMALMKDKRVLILGGRQSAFEWAALLQEAGAKMIHISHRHNCPAFKTSEWAWVNDLVANLENDPAWFRKLSPEEKDDAGKRLWSEGRLKIEPWLEKRIMKQNVQIWSSTQIGYCNRLANNELDISLDNGTRFIVDHIIFATGYKVAISDLPFFANGNILSGLSIQNDFPVLDESFQTNLPGLYITGLPASQDFGPYFGFTITARTSALLIGKALINKSRGNQV